MRNQTLIGQLKTIEEIPDYVEIDKGKEYRETIEEWRQKNSLLERVIQNETSISKEFEKVVEKIGGIKNFVPHYIGNELKKDIGRVIELVGYGETDNFSNLVMNPISFGGIISALAYGICGRTFNQKMNRRKFLDIVKGFSFRMGLVGVGIGGFVSYNKLESSWDAKENAIYLDNKIKELYHN